MKDEKIKLLLLKKDLQNLTERVIELQRANKRNELIYNLAIADSLPFKRKDLMVALGIKSRGTMYRWLRNPNESLKEHKEKTTLLNYYYYVMNYNPRLHQKFQDYILKIVEAKKEEVRRVLDQKVRYVVN